MDNIEPGTTAGELEDMEVISIGVLFVKVPQTGKSPAYRYQLALPDTFKGLVVEGAIWAERGKDGQSIEGYNVDPPGGRSFGGSFKAAKATIEHGGKVIRLADDDPEGLRKMLALE